MAAKAAGSAHPPSVEAVLAVLRSRLPGSDGAALTVVVREVLEDERARTRADAPVRAIEALAKDAVDRLERFASAGIEPVINATGVIIHTNLGRAPWPSAVANDAADLAREAVLLELDRATGRRGPRAASRRTTSSR